MGRSLDSSVTQLNFRHKSLSLSVYFCAGSMSRDKTVLFLKRNLHIVFFVCVCLFAPQMGPLTRGGWVGAARSISTGGDQGLASRNVPVASTGTALTPSTTATVTPTTNNGKTIA